MSYSAEIEIYGGNVTGYSEDDVIVGTVEYSVTSERGGKHCPAEVDVCDISCVSIARTDGFALDYGWEEKFESYADNNPEELIEHAQYEMESRRESRRSVDYDAWREQKMDGVI